MSLCPLVFGFQVSFSLPCCSAAAAFLSFALCFIFSLSSSSQLLLYFTAIKPGNFNQVAQREFLPGQERTGELLFNVAVLSFLFSSPPPSRLSFLPQLNSTLALYSLWFNFQFVLQRYLPGGWCSAFVLMCLYNARLWYSWEHRLTDTCIWISNSASAELLALFYMSHIETGIILLTKSRAEICITNIYNFLLLESRMTRVASKRLGCSWLKTPSRQTFYVI